MSYDEYITIVYHLRIVKLEVCLNAWMSIDFFVYSKLNSLRKINVHKVQTIRTAQANHLPIPGSNRINI